MVVEALKPQSVEDDPCEGSSFSNSSTPSQVPQYHFFGLANTETQSENASKKGFQYDPLSSQLGDPKLSDQRASTRVKEYTDLSIVSVASDIQCKQAGRGGKY